MSTSPVYSGHLMATSATQSSTANSAGSRVLQACNACRRRKTKCNGVRPACKGCVQRSVSCTWPITPCLLGDEAGLAPTPTVEHEHDHQEGEAEGEEPALKRRRRSRTARHQGGNHLSTKLLQRALDIFRARHYSIEFCSFFHVSSLEADVLRRQSAFLAHALVALAGLYMSLEEAVEEGFATPTALSDWHTIVAREHSCRSVAMPSISSIQANLVLSLKELLARTAYKAWICTGIAVRQAQALRLGMEYHQRLSNRQKEVQRRTYWSCFLMDRLVSQCCWRPQMIDAETVRVNIPCPENIFVFDEVFNGPNLKALTIPYDICRHGTAPYFFAVLHLWAQATYAQVKGDFRENIHRSSDAEGRLSQLERKIDDLYGSLPPAMQWNSASRIIFRHTHQEALFVNFHFLLSHARCVMYQEYIPYQDVAHLTTGEQGGQYRGVLTSPYTNGRESRTVSVCISSSEAIIDMMNELFHPNNSSGAQDLRSVFAAQAMLSAVNIQLWLQYVERNDDNTCRNAAARVAEVAAVFESWRTQWPVADAWMSTLVTLRRLYQATYETTAPSPEDAHPGAGHTQISEDALSPPPPPPPPPPAVTEIESQERPSPTLTEGNGLPEMHHQMIDKIRFILLASLEDTDARERVLNSSMSVQRRPSCDYDGLFQDWETEFSGIDIDGMWADMVSGLA